MHTSIRPIRTAGAFRRMLAAAAVVVLSGFVLPMATSGAAIVVPEPIGPWGYTNGFTRAGGGVMKCNFYRVALGNGVAEKLNENSVACVDGLTFSPAGVLYGYTLPADMGAGDESHLVTINTATGAQTQVGPMGHGFFEGGMTFDKDGKLWLYSEPDDDACVLACLFAVDPATGAAAVVGVPGIPGFVPTGLAANCSTVYATGAIASGFPGDSLYTVNTGTGAVALVGPTNQPVFTEGLDFAADGTLYAIGEPFFEGPVSYAPKSFTVDPATGAGTNVQTWVSDDETPNSIFGLAIAGQSCTPPVVELQPNFTG